MQELKFVRTEDGSLVVTDDVGEFYKVLVDDAVLSGIRHIARGDQQSKASPKEIQALIRTGKSTVEVAELTGASLEDVERFAAPVLDEREFILENALRVTVVTNPADSHTHSTSFGAAMAERLDGLSAQGIAWSAWKDDIDGWLIAVDFTSREVAHHALWSFDHRKNVLTPKNADATSLSKQGEVGDRLIPKLRAVEVQENSERFDSGAFRPEVATSTIDPVHEEHHEEVELAPEAFDSPEEDLARRQHIEERAVAREEEPVDFGQTADLLDALRRRRGERDSQPQPVLSTIDAGLTPPPAHAPAMETPAPAATSEPEIEATQPLDLDANDSGKVGNKRGRQGMPSWDDILFGTRSEEDPS